MASQYRRREMDGGEDMKQGGGSSKRKRDLIEEENLQQYVTCKTWRMKEWVSFCKKNLFFLKAKTNIYLFIINYCQHCRVSSKLCCFAEVIRLCFNCQDFKINDLYCWRTSIEGYGTLHMDLHILHTMIGQKRIITCVRHRQTQGGLTVHISPHSASHCYLETPSLHWPVWHR